MKSLRRGNRFLRQISRFQAITIMLLSTYREFKKYKLKGPQHNLSCLDLFYFLTLLFFTFEHATFCRLSSLSKRI